MKESIAQSFIISLILFFFGILVLLLFGSINYSKAFKAKNRIINIIQKYGEFNDATRTEIAESLQKGGYQTALKTDYKKNPLNSKCNKYAKELGVDSKNIKYPASESDYNGGRYYDYCVIEVDAGLGNYYQVVTFMKFEVPLVRTFLEFAVKGETKVLYETIYETS